MNKWLEIVQVSLYVQRKAPLRMNIDLSASRRFQCSMWHIFDYRLSSQSNCTVTLYPSAEGGMLPWGMCFGLTQFGEEILFRGLGDFAAPSVALSDFLSLSHTHTLSFSLFHAHTHTRTHACTTPSHHLSTLAENMTQKAHNSPHTHPQTRPSHTTSLCLSLAHTHTHTQLRQTTLVFNHEVKGHVSSISLEHSIRAFGFCDSNDITLFADLNFFLPRLHDWMKTHCGRFSFLTCRFLQTIKAVFIDGEKEAHAEALHLLFQDFLGKICLLPNSTWQFHNNLGWKHAMPHLNLQSRGGCL